MRYLEVFESFTDDRFDFLEDFCRDSLSYLTDEGYVITIERTTTPRSVRMMGSSVGRKSCIFRLYHKDRNFKWDEIESDFTPFLELLNGKYQILKWYGSEGEPEISVESTSVTEQFNVEKVINGERFINGNIIDIKIKIAV
jgi:hypothetical protein